eukprot:CAMPEP_0168276532 /NCGR_PEP_ID=MMETSP0141_2-20121125/18615_1 /TAXON_ID=44445 /ORGANISM="Pseudo-nitzschia australis, Strain 10249 10 AB" /LENGTH=171 /DNA_ID=CAMNT_0008218659 /DNA_START=443 /DNA_END=954 /DNA_ORIENTATION=-
MTSVMKTLQSITQQNNVIAQQHNALLTEVVGLCKAHNARVSPPVTTGALDDMSASTDILEWFTDMSTATSPTAFLSLNKPATRDRITERRNPKSFQHLNDGKGKVFASYCWCCGCNCTHWTCRCNCLTPDKRDKYKAADFDNRMGGSTKYLECCDHYYQIEYGFDSILTCW